MGKIQHGKEKNQYVQKKKLHQGKNLVAGAAELPDRAGQEWAGNTVPELGAEQGWGPGQGWAGGRVCSYIKKRSQE